MMVVACRAKWSVILISLLSISAFAQDDKKQADQEFLQNLAPIVDGLTTQFCSRPLPAGISPAAAALLTAECPPGSPAKPPGAAGPAQGPSGGLAPTPSNASAPGPSGLYQRPNIGDCASPTANTNINYFPLEYRITGPAPSNNVTQVIIPDAFNITYFNNYKVVQNNLLNDTYILYQCGTTPPPLNQFPAGAKLFSIPLTSVAVLETVPVAFLELLGVIDRAQSVSQYSVSGCGQYLLGCGRVAPDGFSQTNDQIQAQLLPFTDGIVASTAPSNDPTFFSFSSTSDPGVLKRAQWVKYLGAFFNLDGPSTDIYNTINTTFYNVAATINANISVGSPILAFTDYFSYAPYSAYEISLATYKQQYASAAGAVNLNVADLLRINGTVLSPYDSSGQTVWFTWNYTNAFPSQSAANAAFKKVLQTVNVLVDETYAPDPTQYNLTTFYSVYNITPADNSSFYFLQNSSVFREDGLAGPPPSYGLDWYEGAIVRPDQVLLDFAQAVNPTSFPSHNRTWIRNIAFNEPVQILTSTNCTQLSSCTQPITPICPLVSVCPNGAVVDQQSVNSTCVYNQCPN